MFISQAVDSLDLPAASQPHTTFNKVFFFFFFGWAFGFWKEKIWMCFDGWLDGKWKYTADIGTAAAAD